MRFLKFLWLHLKINLLLLCLLSSFPLVFILANLLILSEITKKFEKTFYILLGAYRIKIGRLKEELEFIKKRKRL